MLDAFLIEFISMVIKTIVQVCCISASDWNQHLVSASLWSFEIIKLPMIKEDVIICLSAEIWAINLILRCFHHTVVFLYSDHNGDSKFHDQPHGR
jgi:hypothetical protein